MRKPLSDRVFDVVNGALLTLLGASMVYPFLYVIAISLNEASDSSQGGTWILPRKLTFETYKIIFVNNDLVSAALVSVARTVLGTVLVVLCSAMFAYVFTKQKYFLYKPMKLIFFVAMFLGGGGLIPVYMLFRSLGLLNTFWVYIIPWMLNLWYVVLFRTYFMRLPREIEEAAFVDGASELTAFFKVILPLSKPIAATITLFAAVAQWNSWRDTLFFTASPSLRTLQYVMMEILQRAEAERMITRAEMLDVALGHLKLVDPMSVRMAITVVTTLPIVLVYPFLQKHFIKGILVGSMKG
ncbi:MAG: carbohydrate ABC transporter permease [Bacillota bacterium]